ncbi:hypothetical protein C8Q76DRAFT_610842 [Earliella scabrosa]|nr:hypothetical protein C8Q76DRAFT_610842 [Earliella scabrosa]
MPARHPLPATSLIHFHCFQHHLFIFTTFNIIQQRAVLLHGDLYDLKVRKAAFASFAADYASISPKAVARVCVRFVLNKQLRAEDGEEQKVVKLMDEIQMVTRQVPRSTGSRLAMRKEICALMNMEGMSSFFLTINPADIYNPLVKFLVGADIEIDRLLPGDAPSYWQQSLLVAHNPVVASRFFHTYIRVFISQLLRHTGPNNRSSGILGTVKAYYGCVDRVHQ